MADSLPRDELLSKATLVFEAAGSLGSAFQVERRSGQSDSSAWEQHQPLFEHFHSLLVDLSEAIKNPPAGFESVATHLRDAARIARAIDKSNQSNAGESFGYYADYFPELRSLWTDGLRAVRAAKKTQASDDPLAFVDSPETDLGALFDAAFETEQAEANERIRQFWIHQFGMPAELTYEQGQAWAQERQAKSDAADKAWREKETALERLVELRCRDRMIAAGFRDDELVQGTYVRCMPRYVDGNDPRLSAKNEAMRKFELDQRAKERLLGRMFAAEHASNGQADGRSLESDAQPITGNVGSFSADAVAATLGEKRSGGGFGGNRSKTKQPFLGEFATAAKTKLQPRLPVFLVSVDQTLWRIIDAETNNPARDEFGDVLDGGGYSNEQIVVAQTMVLRLNGERGASGDTTVHADAYRRRHANLNASAANAFAGATEAKPTQPAVEPLANGQIEPTPAAAVPTDNASMVLMRVFTNGIADDRIAKAAALVTDDRLSVNDKLSRIDALIPFPANASAEQLGEMLGKTKQAVLKTEWWKLNRKGERNSEVGRRRDRLHERAKSYETPSRVEDEDEG